MNDRHQQKPYPLRISEKLRDSLQAEAEKNGRSLNAEITVRLERSLEPIIRDGRHLDLKSLAKELNELVQQLPDTPPKKA